MLSAPGGALRRLIDETVSMNHSQGWNIDALDGQEHTLLSFSLGEWEAMIGGGPDRFVVTASAGGGSRIANARTLREDIDDEETVDLTVGGQSIDYPWEYALTREEALAAMTDLAAGQLSGEQWEVIP